MIQYWNQLMIHFLGEIFSSSQFVSLENLWRVSQAQIITARNMLSNLCDYFCKLKNIKEMLEIIFQPQ
jgi:hypothetical protein